MGKLSPFYLDTEQTISAQFTFIMSADLAGPQLLDSCFIVACVLLRKEIKSMCFLLHIQHSLT